MESDETFKLNTIVVWSHFEAIAFVEWILLATIQMNSQVPLKFYMMMKSF